MAVGGAGGTERKRQQEAKAHALRAVDAIEHLEPPGLRERVLAGDGKAEPRPLDLAVRRRLARIEGIEHARALGGVAQAAAGSTLVFACLRGAMPAPRSGRVVFGLITGSMVIGLASQDTAENALADVGLDKLRFVSPVHHGDTLYAYTEVLAARDAPDREDAGLVTFKHWGATHEGRLVFEGERTVLLKKRSHWADK